MGAKAKRLGEAQLIVLIGGGATMLGVAEYARATGLETRIILAPRHAEEPLADASNTADAYRSRDFTTFLIEDMDQDASWRDGIASPSALALCFGPAWIFSAETRAAFGLGMYNYNGIPIPRYLGGAHFTWQILNDDRSAGCCLQEITGIVDRGDILRLEQRQLSDDARLPEDYFRETDALAEAFMRQVIKDIVADVAFEPKPWASVAPDALYFPRLMTRANGVIDWRWRMSEIERFCRAFDRPYPGARARWRDAWVSLGDVQVGAVDPAMHAFAAGLVLRLEENATIIAAPGGHLRVGRITLDDGAPAPVRLGDRLHASPEDVHAAMAYRPRFSGKGVRPA